MKTRQLGVFLLVAAFALVATQSVWAATPYDRTVDPAEDMEHDTDAFTPDDVGLFAFDPLNDPDQAGLPPGDGVDDWRDARNGAPGLMEEVPDGFGGVNAPVGSYNGHLPAPHSGDALPTGGQHFAIVQFEGAAGPFGFSDYVDAVNPAPGGTGNRTGYWATMDLYIDPARVADADGSPDFWWTNAINPIAGFYLTESGFSGTVNAGNLTWRITTTTGGQPFLDIPVGTWIGLEVEPKLRALDGGLDIEHRIYADGGTHAVQIYSHTIPGPATGPGAFATLAGPAYNQFTNAIGGNMPYLLVDNVGWTAVPEPGTATMLGLGAIGMVAAYRRRRRTHG